VRGMTNHQSFSNYQDNDDEAIFEIQRVKDQIVPVTETLSLPFIFRRHKAIVPSTEVLDCSLNRLPSFELPQVVPNNEKPKYNEQVFMIDNLVKLMAIDNDKLLFKALSNGIVIVYSQYNFDDLPIRRPYTITLMIEPGELYLFNLYMLGTKLPIILQSILGNELIVKLGYDLFFNEFNLRSYYEIKISPRLDIRQILQSHYKYSSLGILNRHEIISRFASHIEYFELSAVDDMLGFDSIKYICYLKTITMGLYISVQRIFDIHQSKNLQMSTLKNLIPQIETILHTNIKTPKGNLIYVLK
jgi:hypothetical protein